MIEPMRIEFKASVLKDACKIPHVFLEKIEAAIRALAKSPIPAGAKKIQGYVDYYRIRIGMYRVVYRVQQKIEIVTIIRIGHRKEAYRKL